MRYSILNKQNFIFILLLSTFLCSCNNKKPTAYEKLEQFCKKHSLKEPLNNFNSVVIISSKGGCINCSNIFAQAMAKKLNNNEHILFIVSDDGTKVDIHNYINRNNKNVIWDKNCNFNHLGLVESSAILNIKNQKIISKKLISIQNIKKFAPE